MYFGAAARRQLLVEIAFVSEQSRQRRCQRRTKGDAFAVNVEARVLARRLVQVDAAHERDLTATRGLRDRCLHVLQEQPVAAQLYPATRLLKFEGEPDPVCLVPEPAKRHLGVAHGQIHLGDTVRTRRVLQVEGNVAAARRRPQCLDQFLADRERAQGGQRVAIDDDVATIGPQVEVHGAGAIVFGALVEAGEVGRDRQLTRFVILLDRGAHRALAAGVGEQGQVRVPHDRGQVLLVDVQVGALRQQLQRWRLIGRRLRWHREGQAKRFDFATDVDF